MRSHWRRLGASVCLRADGMVLLKTSSSRPGGQETGNRKQEGITSSLSAGAEH